uniref:Uncharacterized protein n=1 Tax=viral metagenome TaxID=1070528 RepID=A0A6M3LSJ9_9ZZZZ
MSKHKDRFVLGIGRIDKGMSPHWPVKLTDDLDHPVELKWPDQHLENLYGDVRLVLERVDKEEA